MATENIKGYPGLSRMLYPEQSVACFRVKIVRQGAVFQEYFPFKSHGGEDGAFDAAKRYWAEVRASFPKLSRKQSAQVERRKSRSGFVGVARVTKTRKGFDYDFWCATWTGRRGERRSRVFSVNKYGETEARKLAEEARRRGLDDFPDQPPNTSLEPTGVGAISLSEKLSERATSQVAGGSVLGR